MEASIVDHHHLDQVIRLEAELILLSRVDSAERDRVAVRRQTGRDRAAFAGIDEVDLGDRSAATWSGPSGSEVAKT